MSGAELLRLAGQAQIERQPEPPLDPALIDLAAAQVVARQLATNGGRW